MDTIEFGDFTKVEMRVGTILKAGPNPKARKPAYVLEIDFGSLGIKQSSAQITDNYKVEDLIGTQVVAVLNFRPKHVAGIRSDVLVLGAVSETKAVVLLRPTLTVENGALIG